MAKKFEGYRMVSETENHIHVDWKTIRIEVTQVWVPVEPKPPDVETKTHLADG